MTAKLVCELLMVLGLTLRLITYVWYAVKGRPAQDASGLGGVLFTVLWMFIVATIYWFAGAFHALGGPS
jgi:hypothetical protein